MLKIKLECPAVGDANSPGMGFSSGVNKPATHFHAQYLLFSFRLCLFLFSLAKTENDNYISLVGILRTHVWFTSSLKESNTHEFFCCFCFCHRDP